MHFTFGAHIYLWTQRWGNEHLALLDRAASLGLSMLEIAIGDDVVLDPAPLRRCAQGLGMQLVLSPGAHWPMECDVSADDPAQRQLGVQWHRRAIDLAAQCGAVAYTGAIYGHPGRVCKRIAPADEMQRTAENLHLLAQDAAERKVKLVLEPMSHFRTHLINTPEQAMRLIHLASHPNLHVLLDTYHLVTEIRDFAQAVRTVGDRLWGIHACENDRGVPGGGMVPWDALLAATRALAGQGCMLLETYNSAIAGFAESRGMFHNVCPDPDDFVRRGIAFLQSRLAAIS